MPRIRPSAPLALLRRVVDVRDGEVGALAASFAYFFVLLGGYAMLRPIRDSLGLVGGPRQLPWLMTGTFAGMVVASPLFAYLVARVPRRRLVPAVYRVFLVMLLGFFALTHAEVAPRAVAAAFFIWVGVYNLLVVSVFWSFMADVWRPAQAGRLFGAIAAGGSLGAIAGPLVTSELVHVVGEAGLMLGAAALLEVAARCARRLGARAGDGPGDRPGEDQGSGGGVLAGAAAIARDPFLAAIAAQTLLFTFASTFLWMQQQTIVSAALTERAARTQLFARVDLAVNLASFVAQAAIFGRLAVRRAGLALALGSVPLVGLVGFTWLALAPTLAVVIGVSIARRATHYAIERPGRELLFTAASREARYKSKNFTDLVVYRGGDMTSGWLYEALRAGGLGLPALSLAALPLALGGAALAPGIARAFRRRATTTTSTMRTTNGGLDAPVST